MAADRDNREGLRSTPPEQPTPTPWKATTLRDGTVQIVGGPRGYWIAVESVGREDAARTLADAELIVAAVNAYQEADRA